MKMDFFDDLSEIARQELIANGYNPPLLSAEEMLRTYLSLLHRTIPTRKRKVLESSQFQIPANLRAGYDEIKRKAQSGESLIAHQTRRLDDPEDFDPLLNDWGIHHLHLGTRVMNHGYIERTGPLLYARVTDDALYAIQVYEHGAWSRQEMIRIIHENWPESVSQFRLKGIVGLATQLSDQQIGNLRQAHVQAMVQVDDAVYAPLGGGVVSSGPSFLVIRATDELRSSCHEIEKDTREVVKMHCVIGDEFSLKRDGKRAVVVETSTGREILETNWLVSRDLE